MHCHSFRSVDEKLNTDEFKSFLLNSLGKFPAHGMEQNEIELTLNSSHNGGNSGFDVTNYQQNNILFL